VQAGGRARPAIHTNFATASSYSGSRKAQLFRNLIVVRDFSSGNYHLFPMGRSMSVKYSPLLGYGLFVTALLATAAWAAFWGWALWRAVALALAWSEIRDVSRLNRLFSGNRRALTENAFPRIWLSLLAFYSPLLPAWADRVHLFAWRAVLISAQEKLHQMLDAGDACSAPHATVAKHLKHTPRLNNGLPGGSHSGRQTFALLACGIGLIRIRSHGE
jgi:hypothetical protein